MRHFLFIVFALCLAPLFAGGKERVQYDTAKTVVRQASVQAEKEVFSDKDFIYHADAKESKNWLEAFMEWLTEQLFGKVSAKNADLTWQIVKWTAIGLFIAGLIFVLWKAKFRGLLRADPKDLGGASFADLPEDIESVHIDTHIEEAVRNGNFRLAIRWCFLKSLQLLNQKNQISWQPAKTNIDYQHELKNAELRERFSKISYVFEYVWYGELSTNENVFRKYREEVEKFNRGIHA